MNHVGVICCSFLDNSEAETKQNLRDVGAYVWLDCVVGYSPIQIERNIIMYKD